MSSLIYFLSETYYLPLILLILCLITMVVGYINKCKFKHLQLFPLYALAAATQIVFFLTCIFFRAPTFRLLGNYSTLIFALIELYIFYNSLFQIIKNKYFKQSMHVMQIIFISFGLFLCLNFPHSDWVPASFNITNLVFLFLPCLFFFYEVFKTSASISLANQPSFWIVTGFSFMIVCTFPFYLLETYLIANMPNLYNQIYTLNYVFYCLIFLLICKAYLCKPITIR